MKYAKTGWHSLSIWERAWLLTLLIGGIGGAVVVYSNGGWLPCC